MFSKRQIEFLIPAFLICVLFIPFFVVNIFSITPMMSQNEWVLSDAEVTEEFDQDEVSGTNITPHIQLPDEVRGIYWTASTAKSTRADELLAYMLETGLNTVVIDVKMDDGTVAFDLNDDANVPYGIFMSSSDELRSLLDKLYSAGIYRIARIAVMRDSAFATLNPEVALRFPEGNYWKDNTGAIWVDPSASEIADYAIKLGQNFYEAGFDEIQFDYVRFASDGPISSIVYPFYHSTESKTEVMQRFFERVGGAMQKEGIPVSFDVFGMTFWSLDDYNIGQRLIDVLPYADFVSPMLYPSHYVDGFKGYANPAEYPYEIVKKSLDEGLRLIHGVFAVGDDELIQRFRPWLQDFDVGAVYTSDYIEAQIQAVRDAGASGWMLWNARNVYEPAEYDKEEPLKYSRS